MFVQQDEQMMCIQQLKWSKDPNSGEEEVERIPELSILCFVKQVRLCEEAETQSPFSHFHSLRFNNGLHRVINCISDFRINLNLRMKNRNSNTTYLDISEFVLKELSPVFKPKPASQPLQIARQSALLSPEMSPVLEARLTLKMTPLFQSQKSDPFHDANFQELENFSLDGSPAIRKNSKVPRTRTRLPSTWHYVDDDLEHIIEENCSEDFEEYFSDSDEDLEISDSDEGDNLQSSIAALPDGEPEKQSTAHIDGPYYEFKSAEWQSANPKKQLIGKLRQIVANEENKSDEEKVNLIKEAIQKYLCQHEKYYFEDSMSSLRKDQPNLTEMVGILVRGIDQTFKRMVGGLIFQKRRIKLLRYLDKKKRRIWKKKVSYDCRKKVADGRLRIKGKFVTHEQACQQLGLRSIEGFTPQEIKEMLYRKLDQNQGGTL